MFFNKSGYFAACRQRWPGFGPGLAVLYMKKLLFPLQAAYTIYALALFIAFLLLVFPFVVVASFLGRVRGGNIIYKLCKCWAYCYYPLVGLWQKNMYEVPHDTKRQYVFVFNHISYIDIPIIMASIRWQHFRILGKAEMGQIPVFGFLYRQAVVMVDRSSVENRARSVRQLKAFISRGISVVIAPEGTFNTTHKPLKDFYDGAFKVAIETQTPIKPLLFLDAYDRLGYENLFSLTPGKTRVVYLEEVSVEGLTVADVAALKEKVYRIMERKLIEYRASWIN